MEEVINIEQWDSVQDLLRPRRVTQDQPAGVGSRYGDRADCVAAGYEVLPRNSIAQGGCLRSLAAAPRQIRRSGFRCLEDVEGGIGFCQSSHWTETLKGNRCSRGGLQRQKAYHSYQYISNFWQFSV